MVTGNGGLDIDHVGKGFADIVHLRDRGQELSAGFEVEHGGAAVVLVPVGPEQAVGVQGLGSPNELRVEPGAAALPQAVQSRRRSASGGEDVKVLRDQQDAAEEGDALPGQVVRKAAAVPVLIQMTNGCGSGLRETDPGNDAGAAIAAKRKHLAVVVALLQAQLEQAS